MAFSQEARSADPELAETTGSMRIWHAADGLASDSVTAVIQTRDGFIWVATSAGVVRFDGVKFTRLELAGASSKTPVYATALCEDSLGHLWIGTREDGLYQLSAGKVQRHAVTEGLLDDGVTSLAADNSGMVWIGTKSGLNLWDGQKFRSFTTRDGLPDKFVSGVNVARSGTVWITTRVGMSRIIDGQITPYAFQTESQGRSPEYLGAYEDRQGNLWAFGDTYLINLAEGKRFNYFRSSESASVRIWSLCEGQDGRLWIGTSGRGLFCFGENRFQPVIIGDNRWSYDVRSICEDREGNLWLGTSGGGLVQLRPQSIHVLRVAQGLPAGAAEALALDSGGHVYVAMQRAGLFAGESGRFERLGGDAGLAAQDLVTSICVSRDKTVWTGTLGDGLYGSRNGREMHLTTADGLDANDTLAVCDDSEDAVWISTRSGAVHRFDGQKLVRYGPAHGLPGTSVTAMIPSPAGGLWLGTQDGQILREENGIFTGIEVSKNLEHHPVLTLQEGDQGRLWIGTSGGGLACLNHGAMVIWNTSNGLPAVTVAGVIEDQNRNLWLATSAGIYRVNRGDVNRTLENPLYPLVCKWMSGVDTPAAASPAFGATRTVLSPDGSLWFATPDGVLKVDTRQTEKSPATFPIYLESAVFNGEPPLSLLHDAPWSSTTASGGTWRTPGDLRSLEIHFTALNFAAPEDLQFRHKLDGFDPDWVDDAAARSARYGRLPYGRYNFRLAVRNMNGGWQEASQSFAFFVPTPLYFQAWAIFLYAVAAIALVAAAVRTFFHRRLRHTLIRLEQQQSLERERMRIARDMHDEIGSKLTKISFLSEHAQVDAKADVPLAHKIASIAQTSRDLLKTMDEIVWVVNPHNDTLDNLVAYLCHYAAEYFQNTSVEFELRLPPEIPHHPLSSEMRHNLFLAFEEALNNVLKHSAATSARVEITISAPDFELKIADNGRGFDAPAMSPGGIRGSEGPGGNGLKNMRQRLEAIGGECLVSSRPGAGATVTLRIRLSRKNRPSS